MAILSRSGSIVSSMNKSTVLPCQGDVDDGDSQGGKITRSSVPDLPEDIWYHIHSLMPLRDAARAACLSRAFLRCWRCRPNLTFNRRVLLSKEHEYDYRVNVSRIIDSILRNHSGTGVKVLKFELYDITDHRLGSWLQVAVTLTIEELTVVPCRSLKKKYIFPCSVLSNGVGNSIQHLELGCCAFHPTAELGPLRNLTSLSLHSVYVTGDELECFLSKCLALEQLELSHCSKIICLKVPCVLQKFSCLEVYGWRRLRVIESKAPNLSSLCIEGEVKLSLGETLKMKHVRIYRSRAICYARANLPSIMPNLESLGIGSSNEEIDTPILPTKFLYLKHLVISGLDFAPSSYDCLSLVSFLDASPSLETFILEVCDHRMEHESVFDGSSGLRQILEQPHRRLRDVKIIRFSSAKSLVELTCHIVKIAVSLECLSLNTLDGFRCSGDAGSRRRMRCAHQSNDILREATRAVAAIRMYIEDRVPSMVKLSVLEPCTLCHKSSSCRDV